MNVRLAAPVIVTLGLIPGVLFLLDRSAPVVGLSIVSVLLIAGSVYAMLGPADRHDPRSTG